MNIRFAPLFSGSSGNSAYIGAGRTHLLSDAGVSCARLSTALNEIGVNPAGLAGILITHEHSDHISGAGVLSRRFDIPIYATGGTWREMESKLGHIETRNARIISADEGFSVGDVDVEPFRISHDAAEPVGFSFSSGGGKISLATDTGVARDGLIKRLLGSDLVLLESNYDPEMLRAGRYPYELKRRIMGQKGHLSNDDAGQAAVKLAEGGVRHIILGHLSKENNFPELALRTVSDALALARAEAEVTVALRDRITGMFEIGGDGCW